MKTPIARLQRIQECEAAKLLQYVIDSEAFIPNIEVPRLLALQDRIDRWERRGWKLRRAQHAKKLHPQKNGPR
jgi:hypothetical protein